MIYAARLISLLALAASLPLSEAKELDVWSPQILHPNKHTVWRVGQHHEVIWDTSNPPAQLTNPIGKIYLVQNRRILYNDVLAEGFDIRSGQVQVRAPNVETGEYRLVLFGDSGNWSELFKIDSK